MSRLIQKAGFMKGGGGGKYMRYIATREGVQIIRGKAPPTENQLQLIRDILRDYPDTNDLFEYEDYLSSPTVASASAFITMALDVNAHSLKESDVYMRYIATRPHVEKNGAHGLFGREQNVLLEPTMLEVEAHKGIVWTVIYSLRREDAVRLGFDEAGTWRCLLLRQERNFAKAIGIPPDQLRWYAAFHDEGSHPHIHMMMWSSDPKQGFLKKDSLLSLQSKLTNDIFRDELHTLYEKKDISYKEVSAAARSAMGELIRQMESSFCDSPAIAQKMTELAAALEGVTGKKQYGYLKKPLKAQVDSIVDELAKIPEVAQCYAVWNGLRDELENYYRAKPREHLPLSQQKEFRTIKNMVIQEADHICMGEVTFEEPQMDAEPEADEDSGGQERSDGARQRSIYKLAGEYRLAKVVLLDLESSPELKQETVQTLERLWDEGFTAAGHLLGKVWRDGLLDRRDMELAKNWFQKSAEEGNHYSQYALGKLLQSEGNSAEAAAWYEKAAAQGNQYAQYRLGKMLLQGDGISKDPAKAAEYLSASAEQGNQYAQYILGKMYLIGNEAGQDREKAYRLLEQSAGQGNQYAQFLLDHFDQHRNPSILLAATRLLYHMGRIFQDNSVPPTNPAGIRIDSKRRRAIMEKRLALGQKLDDHEDLASYTQRLS
nr:MobP3 family relaxase [uncultured Oscillibacter sp.]